MYRCDEPMRKSKEKCFVSRRIRWRCDKDCLNCFCCLIKDPDGTEHHFNPLGKGERYEIQYPQQTL